MKQALEALETVFMPHHPAVISLRTAIAEAEKQEGWVLREVLFDKGEPIAHREPEKQEPVAWMNRHGACKTSLFREVAAGAKDEYTIPLYTHPPAAQPDPEFECPRCGHCCPQRQWVDLTDEDIENCYGGEINDFARAVIDKFKGKNT